MTNKETAEHIKKYVANRHHHEVFSWPTDACGYEQHIRFVEHRNKNWKGGTIDEFDKFIIDYADMIEKEG